MDQQVDPEIGRHGQTTAAQVEIDARADEHRQNALGSPATTVLHYSKTRRKLMAYNVPVYSQSTLNRCWEACGHMLWDWFYRNNRRQRQRYARRAGSYATLDRGLSEQEMTRFYAQLGIRSLRNPGGRNVRHALRWTPVIITSVHQTTGHAMVVTGYANGNYTVVNPCAQQIVSFEPGASDSCTAGSVRRARADVDDPLGAYIWYW
jgi:hypothetical protein